MLKSPKPYIYLCEVCGKKFNYECNFKRHQRECCSDIWSISTVQRTKCCLCDSLSSSRKSYLDHLGTVHGVQIIPEHLEFSSFSDFEQWKEATEKTTRAAFVKNCGVKKAFDGTTKYYYICHRSGHVISKGTGVRCLKVQGSKKIGGVCPAQIKVTQTSDGPCHVIFVSTHVGHDSELCHLGLTKRERASLAADIANNIPFQALLDKVRDSVSASELQRIHLLTRQDLANIARSFNLYPPIKHHNDAVSADALVHEMNSDEDSCNVKEREEIPAQVSRNQPSNGHVSLSHEKDMLTSKILELVGGISTFRELEVLKKQVNSFEATLTAVRNDSHTVFAPGRRGTSCKRKIAPQRVRFSTKKKRPVNECL